jgi:hypothetical protein
MFERISIIASAAILLVACVGAQAQERFAQAESSRRVCTQQYDPVCARRGTSYRTFGNACEAQVAGYFVDRKGRCDFSGNDRSRNDPPALCTREYDPVCATRGKGRKTFGNACEAQAAGYRIVHGGRC